LREHVNACECVCVCVCCVYLHTQSLLRAVGNTQSVDVDLMTFDFLALVTSCKLQVQLQLPQAIEALVPHTHFLTTLFILLLSFLLLSPFCYSSLLWLAVIPCVLLEPFDSCQHLFLDCIIVMQLSFDNSASIES